MIAITDQMYWIVGFVIVNLGGLAGVIFIIVLLMDLIMQKTMNAKKLMDVIYRYTKERI